MQSVVPNVVAIITGASSGIGQATAVALAREGAKIAFLSHSNNEGSEETIHRVKEAGSEAIQVRGDVGEAADVDRLFDASKERFGPPTILVNDAGINAAGVPVKEMDAAGWEKTLRTDLTGPFLCCRRFVRDFVPGDRRGKIVNVTSVHEELARVGGAAYAAAKGGLRNLTRCLALEVAEHISVVNVAPGMILTPMNERAMEDEAYRKEVVQNIPAKRAGTPEEVAALIRFLCSSEGDYCTGSTYFIDGGLMLNLGQGA